MIIFQTTNHTHEIFSKISKSIIVEDIITTTYKRPNYTIHYKHPVRRMTVIKEIDIPENIQIIHKHIDP